MDSQDIPKASGIYCITCLPTSKMYIGSAVNLRKRQQDHWRDIRQKKHHNQKLQRAWNKYGPDTFVFSVLELVLPPFLIEREQYWIDHLNPFFNIARVAGSLAGLKRPPISPITRERLRTSHLGQSGHWTGKKRPPETSAKISASKLGKPSPRRPGYTHSLEHREKLRLANLGKKQSEETRRKAGDTHRGIPKSPESIEKTRLANLGRKNTPESITRMKNAHAGEMKVIIVTFPDGTEQVIHGIHQFCRDHNLDRRSLQRVAQGQLKQHKGYRVRFLD